ncbi:unnamed protein product [Phytophthora fragariaefolia]|uniref:Unnamed protein product n=1 Tax=Phytophthora fragariaefolia TaxID=1490495 RepID=A0A9W6XG36_9STRA|nr:unnamed protein product [Phytophthora fragariaefolia]
MVKTTENYGGTRVEAGDGLPTAMMLVDGTTQCVKMDSGARYSVADTDWMTRSERKTMGSPVAYIEGIGGFLLDVLGVWTFDMVNAYGQAVGIDSCIIDGCTDDFWWSSIFLKNTDPPWISTVARMAGATNLRTRAVRLVEVAIAAPDGEEGGFLPTVNNGAVLLAAAVTKVMNGKALIPAINAYGGRIRLPRKLELGVWIPINRDMESLRMYGELETERVQKWLEELGYTDTHRAYRDLANAQDEYPPTTTLNVEHHIDTRDAASIMMRRRQQTQTEDAIADSNVNAMISAGTIEHGEGA